MLFQVVFSDFTRIVYARGKRSIWLIIYIEAVSKKVIGYKLGAATTANALIAYRSARQFLKRKGVKLIKCYFHHDHLGDCSPDEYITHQKNKARTTLKKG